MNKEISTASLALAANQKKKEKAYWMNRLSGQPVKSSFPFDFDQEEGSVPYRLETLDFSLDEGIYRQLIELSKGSDERLFIVLLTGVLILLRKYSGSRDILSGIPVARPRDNTTLINHALTIRTPIHDTLSFRQFSSQVRRTVIEAVNHQNFPIEILAGLLEMTWFPGQGFPLFDVVVSLKNIHHDTLHELYPNIIVSFERNSKGVKGMFSFNAGRYGSAAIERLAAHYRALLEGALADPDIQISAIELLSKEEKQEILVSFNETDADFPAATAVHELVDRQAGLTPQADAVIYKDQRLSYGELEKKTGEVAAALRQKGVEANTIAAVLFDHSPGMVVTLIGILKAGGAYLPIDPGIPAARIQYLVKDSGAKYIITADRYLDKIPDHRDRVLPYTQLTDNFSPGPLSEEKRNHQPHHLAYIMYTSGSTGKPKGVMIRHKSFIDFITWAVEVFEHCPGYQVLLSNSYASDGSIQQIYPPLVSGGALHLVDKELRLDVARYLDYLKENRINNIDEVPVLMNELVGQVESAGREEALPDLTCLCLGSEYVPIELVRKCRKYLNRGGRIINAYGPAEASVETTFYYFDGTSDSEISLIGKPRSNTRVYILDQAGNCCPIGVRGEICISGVGLAAGYFNQPELTAEKFLTVSNKSYKSYRSYISKRLYKSGDQGCWLPDGNIRFFGRIDNQIQVRGYRVELSGIQEVLKSYEGVKDAVVVTRENKSGETAICAYYIGKPQEEEVRRYLEDRLPSYMVPSYLTELESIPLTPNGKLDQKALPEPGSVSAAEYTPPRDNLEKKLVAIWSEVLNLDPGTIGIHNNFFKTGGHSLKAAILTSRVQKQLDVDMPLIQVFKTPSIAGLAEYLTGAEKSEYTSIENTELKEYYQLTPVQKRLYIIQQLDTSSIAYNVTEEAYIEKSIGIERVEEIFKKIIGRHEILRTSFKIIDEEPGQIIHKQVPFEIEESVDMENFIRPFDLSRAPQLRVGFQEQEGQNNMFIVDMHHIVCDPFSPRILIDEFRALYNQEELPVLRLQYRDYAAWQNRPEQKIKINRQGSYWKTLFSDNLPVLTLPTDFPRPSLQTFEGASVNFMPEEDEARKIRNMAAENNVTMFMIILAVFNVFLAKICGQEDIIVGTPTSSRLHQDIEEMIGMFVNTLAVRNYPAQHKTFKEFLQEVKAQTLEAFRNQEYPFEDLVDEISLERDTSRNPLFDVMFNHLKQPDASVSARESDLHRHKTVASKFDITLTAEEYDNNLLFNIEYCTRLFNAETIDRIVGYFKSTYRTIIEDPGVKISAIRVISEEEKRWLLFDFNDTETGYPKDKMIHELFEKQVEKTPHHIALVGPSLAAVSLKASLQLTYRELHEKSNRLSLQLKEKGVQPGMIGGIMVERSVEMVLGILAVIKAGGAYLPIDPAYPGGRVTYMLEDSSVGVVITQNRCTEKLAAAIETGPVIGIPIDDVGGMGSNNDTGYGKAPGSRRANNQSGNLIYTIYTSGSTGRPKVAGVYHPGFMNLLHWYISEFELQAHDNVLMITSISFDLTQKNVFAPLLKGGRLYLPRVSHFNPRAIAREIQDNNITWLNCTPGMFNQVIGAHEQEELDRLSSLKYVFLGGEPIVLPLLMKWIDSLYNHAEVVNTYGPTECTDVCAYYRIKDLAQLDGKPVPIGKPVYNVQLYVLDRNHYLVPAGMTGELYISGQGVGIGYLNVPEQTKEKFIPNPFNRGSASMYGTGDLARLTPEGIEFVGRIDHQVKVRGFRVELGEIENQLQAHNEIDRAAVITKKDAGGENSIWAYIVSKKEFTILELQEYLLRYLPDYMVPSYFVNIEKIPLTGSGKTDREALQKYGANITSGIEYAEPENEMEILICNTWKTVLKLEKVGIHDDFFNIGGNSLKVIQLNNKLKQVLEKEISVVRMFEYRTIHSLARYLSGDSAGESSGGEGIDRSEIINKARKTRTSRKAIRKRRNYNVSSDAA